MFWQHHASELRVRLLAEDQQRVVVSSSSVCIACLFPLEVQA